MLKRKLLKKSVSVLVAAMVGFGVMEGQAEAAGIWEQVAKQVVEILKEDVKQPDILSKPTNSPSKTRVTGNKKQIVDELNHLDQLFVLAIEKGDIDTVKSLIQQGMDVNTVYVRSFGDHGQTPFRIALDKNNRNMQQLLLENGADITGYYTKHGDHISYLVLAASYNNVELVKYLHAWGAPIKGEGEFIDGLYTNGNALKAALSYYPGGPDIELVKYLLDEGCQVVDDPKGVPNSISNVGGETPFLYLVKWPSRRDLLELFVRYGANVKAVDNEGKNALDLAIGFKDLEYYKYINSIYNKY